MKNKSLIILLWLFIPVFLFYGLSRRITKIECYTQFGPCSDNITASLQMYKNKLLISRIKSLQIVSLIGKPESFKSVKIFRRFPQTLVITLIYRQAILRVNSAVLGFQTAVDSEGMVINTNNTDTLPYLNTPQKYKPGDMLDKQSLKAVQVTFDLSKILLKPVKADFVSPIIKTNIDGSEILLDINYLSDDWSSSLQKVLSRSKINSKVPKIIDLRFSQPVLTY